MEREAAAEQLQAAVTLVVTPTLTLTLTLALTLTLTQVEQNDRGAHLALSPLEWELQTVHAPSSQARIAAALPLRRTIELSDGDLVLLCTGRFHAVEKFEGGDRLSGQCWLSYKRGSPLRIWV